MIAELPDVELILAIDPGTGTGVAWCDENGEHFGSGEIHGWLVFADWFRRITTQAHYHVVMERFDITNQTVKTKIVKDSLWIEGVVINQCTQLGWPWEFQGRGERLWVTNEKLLALGWHKKTKDNHANDAARHLLTYMVKTKQPGHRRLLKEISDVGRS